MNTNLSYILQAATRIVNLGLAKELEAQGHKLTGALEASLSSVVGEESAEGTAFNYLRKLNDGVPASQIQANASALAEMTAYVELRMGYRGSKAMRVAYLILKRQQREGMPTRNSYNYATNGQRLGAIDRGFAAAERKLDEHMDRGIFGYLDEAADKKNESI